MGKIEKITPAKSGTEKGKRPVDRQARKEALAKALTVTFTLEPAVHRFMSAQAKSEEMNLTHYMQKLIETHVIEAAPKDDPLALRLAGKRHVITHALETARKLDKAGKFDEHFILTVVKEAEKDAEFVKHYECALGGREAEGTRIGERQRVSLNQQIGRVIKKAVGARSKRNEETGKIARAQVSDAIITTYTLLEKPA
ncbi:hypothetical protein AB2B41_07780 [Marimonas sp. MJW-29]|uniref:Uncharacterized protein n=1 Tax=Sulfitobacter sediminis TaxID=3234186 RepID=A0ABV3RKI7_9RHOB